MATRLADLPGLTSAKRLALKLYRSPVQAVLLYGSPGAHQDVVAQAIAEAWLCLAPTADGACGSCQACGAVSRGSNPDLQIVKPFGKGELIKLAQIYKSKKPLSKEEEPNTVPLREYSRTGPLMSSCKVAILAQIERMNYEAANAFLKLLEEPQPSMRFILWTSSIGRVIPTVVSRCLTLSCELPPDEAIREQYGPLADIYLVAPHLASRFSEDREGFDSLSAFAISLKSAPPASALKLADDFRELAGDIGSEEGSDRMGLAESLELLAILVARDGTTPSGWVPAILEAHRRVLGNVNARTVLDALFVELVVR